MQCDVNTRTVVSRTFIKVHSIRIRGGLHGILACAQQQAVVMVHASPTYMPWKISGVQTTLLVFGAQKVPTSAAKTARPI